MVATVRSWAVGEAPCTEDHGTARGYLEFNAWDPHAVKLTMYDGGDAVSWTFARELLRDGMTEPAGMGDVAVWPDTDVSGRVCIRLVSPEGTCVLYVAGRARVRAWVRRTYVAVPAGSEDYGMRADGVLTRAIKQFTPAQACERNACERCHQWDARNDA